MSGNAYFSLKNIGRREGAMGAGFSNLLNKGQFIFTRCAWNSFTEREAMLGLDKVEENLIFYPQLGLSPLKIPRCVRLRHGGETRLGRTKQPQQVPLVRSHSSLRERIPGKSTYSFGTFAITIGSLVWCSVRRHSWVIGCWPSLGSGVKPGARLRGWLLRASVCLAYV